MVFTNNIDPILLTLGSLELRWYGLLFASGLFFAYLVNVWVFKREKLPLADLDSLVLYLFLGVVVGARLGHVFFYDAAYFLSNPIEILRVWNGGLASHGAAIGLVIAIFAWTRIHKKMFAKYSDLLVIGMPLAAGFVRIGNYFNSEIVGKTTDGSFGVVFERLGEDFARHPSQFYEAVLSFAIFGILIFAYKKFYKKMPAFFMTFLFVFLYFLSRFFVEFFKEYQALPSSFPLTMGQILSVLPVILATVYFGFIFSKKMR